MNVRTIKDKFRLLIKQKILLFFEGYMLRQRRNYILSLLTEKLPFIQSLNSEERKEIDEIWNPWIKGRNLFDYRWFSFYKYVQKTAQTEYKLCYYVPDDFWEVYVDAIFTTPQKAKVLDDKNMYDMYFHDVNMPKTIFRKIGDIFLDKDYGIIDFETVYQLCKNEKEVIIKAATDSCGGKGIIFFNEGMSKSELKSFLIGNNIIGQEVVKQHKCLSNIHSSSINTIRMMVMIFDGEPHILSSVLRMGANHARVDNAHSGGIFCGINDDGTLKSPAYDVKGNVYQRHPQGAILSDVVIHNYDKCVELIKRLSTRLSYTTRLQSWDLSIDVDGTPMVIEINNTFGGIDLHQMSNGPILGDLTPTILEYVFNNNPLLNGKSNNIVDETALTENLIPVGVGGCKSGVSLS